jgi:hypothetical protein
MPQWLTNIIAQQQIDDCGSSFQNITNLMLTVRRQSKVMIITEWRIKVPVSVVLRVEDGTFVGDVVGTVVGNEAGVVGHAVGNEISLGGDGSNSNWSIISLMVV